MQRKNTNSCGRWHTLLRSLPLLGLVYVLMFFQALATAAPPATDEVKAHFGGVYRRPLRDNPASLDPARTADIYAYTVIHQLFDGLVQFDHRLQPVPAIASFWEASLDGLTWTFSLRKGVRFHNGREVTADDFVYSFTRILDPAVQSPVASLFKHIRGADAFLAGQATQVEGLQALDRYTLRIILHTPYAPFLSILAMANTKVVPREEVEKRGAQFGLRPVGTGPFTFVQWDQKQHVILQAFQSYYEGRPFLDQIVFVIGKKETESLQEFLQGHLEEAIVPSAKAAEIAADARDKSYTHIRKPALHLLYIGFNMRLDALAKPQVRQAFHYAIDREAIVRDIRGPGSIVAHSMLAPGMPGHDPNRRAYPYDPQRARQLLAEAGYPGGAGLPVLDLWYSSQEESTPRELAAYQKYLADIGVRINVRAADNWPALEALLHEGKAAMFRLSWHSDIPDPDHVFFSLLFSGSKTNRTFYQNPTLDRLLQEARRESRYLKRIEIYREIEQLALSDAPWINQHHRVFEYLYQPYVQGVEGSALGAQYVPMKKLWLQKTPRHMSQQKP